MGVGMSKKIEIDFKDYKGKARLISKRKGDLLKYDENLTGFSYLIVFSFFIYLSYMAVSRGGAGAFFKALLIMVLLAAILAFVLKMVSFVFGSLGRIFYNPKIVSIENDIIYADQKTVDGVQASKAGVATKLASLAMAGAMSDEGKGVGRNLYLGAAVMTPGTSKKTSSIITFLHKNGEMGSVVTDEKTAGKIIDSINQNDADVAREYVTYLEDSKKNPKACYDEVSAKLDTLESELSKQSKLSESAPTANDRAAASEACDILSKRLRLFNILKKQIDL